MSAEELAAAEKRVAELVSPAQRAALEVHGYTLVLSRRWGSPHRWVVTLCVSGSDSVGPGLAVVYLPEITWVLTSYGEQRGFGKIVDVAAPPSYLTTDQLVELFVCGGAES